MLARSYNEVNIRQRKDGFLDATAIAKAGGLDLRDWWRQPFAFKYLIALAKKEGTEIHSEALALKAALEANVVHSHIDKKGRLGARTKLSATLASEWFPGLVEVHRGGSAPGTWVHPKLGVRIAQSASEDLAVEVDGWVVELLTKGSATYDNPNPDLGTAIADWFIQDKARKWELHFDPIWQREACRVTGYHWSPDIRMAKFIWQSIYCYFPYEVRRKLLTVNSDRKSRHHQFFTKDADEIALKRHIDRVCGLLIASKSKTQFWQNYTDAFSGGIQIEMDLGGGDAAA